MGYSKKGWDIVADLIRLVGEEPGLLNDIQTDMFHNDIANIMDYMCHGKTFKGATKMYREENENGENPFWLEEFLDKLNINIR